MESTNGKQIKITPHGGYTHHPNVDVRKLVKVLEDSLQTTQETINNAKEECRAPTIVGIQPHAFYHGLEHLNNRNE